MVINKRKTKLGIFVLTLFPSELNNSLKMDGFVTHEFEKLLPELNNETSMRNIVFATVAQLKQWTNKKFNTLRTNNQKFRECKIIHDPIIRNLTFAISRYNELFVRLPEFPFSWIPFSRIPSFPNSFYPNFKKIVVQGKCLCWNRFGRSNIYYDSLLFCPQLTL